MTEAPIDAADVGDDDDADREVVERERAELREFIKGLSPHDIKSGGWFTKLSAQALSSYTDKVDWQYFQKRYEGLPADAIVGQRVKMAARDAQLMLRPYCQSDAADHAIAVARSTGLAAEKSMAIAEAAMIVTALAGRRRGEADHQDGDATLYVSTGEGDDLLREAARLILVSRAMRHSGIARNVTGSAAGE